MESIYLYPISFLFDADVGKDYKLASMDVPNVLMWAAHIQETDRALFFSRQFLANSLYDRISTRPFLNTTEKKWVAFQLMNAVAECHQRGLVHGDIKTENLLITSWNWVYLADFAPYKPVYLPDDDPADFAYFFDSSQRRTCYLAPERFKSPQELKQLQTGQPASVKDIPIPTREMDVFSVGCVIAELFLEGGSIFSLSQLLRYRQGEYDPSVELTRIDDEPVRDLIRHMIQLDPKERLPVYEYLRKWKHAFPEFFPEFHEFMVGMIDPVQNDEEVDEGLNVADRRLLKLYNDFSVIAKQLGIRPSTDEDTECQDMLPLKLDIPDYPRTLQKGPEKSGEVATLVITAVCSCIRSLTRPSIKLFAADLMLACGVNVHDVYKLDRVLPYLLHLLTDPATIVRITALKAVTQLLSDVHSVKAVDADIFLEYILPYLVPFASDKEVIVRVTFAKCIASLAESALRFLEYAQLTADDEKTSVAVVSTENLNAMSYDAKLKELQEVIQDLIVRLLIDPESIVKRALLSEMTTLCMFFGRQKANDVLLSHMITYLNDKDRAIRAAFFENIVGVGTFVGGRSLEQFILPLMIQSLNDPEASVVVKVLASLKSLTELGLFPKMKIRELVQTIAPLMVHPNTWIRSNAIQFIETTKSMSQLDLYVLIIPVLRPFLKSSITEISAEKLRETLLDPIPLTVYQQGIVIMEQFRPRRPSRDIRSPLAAAATQPQADTDELRKLMAANSIPVEEQSKLILLKDFLARSAAANSSSKASANSVSKSWDPMHLEAAPLDVDGTVQVKSLNVQTKTVFMSPPDYPTPVASPQRSPVIKDSTASSRERTRSTSVPVVDTHTLQVPTSPNLNRMRSDSHLSNMAVSDYAPSSLKETVHLMQRTSPVRATASTSTSIAVVQGTLEGPTQADLESISDLENLTLRGAGMKPPSAQTHQHRKRPSVSISSAPMNKPRGSGSNEPEEYMPPELRSLLLKKATLAFPPSNINLGVRVHAPVSFRNRKVSAKGYNIPSLSSWRPQGISVAHFSEHTKSVNQLAVAPDNNFIVSCSDDGSCKVWDCQRLEKNISNRSRVTYTREGKWSSILFCENTHTFAASNSGGFVDLVNVEYVPSSRGPPRYGRPKNIKTIQIEDEIPLAMDHFYADTKSVLIMGTQNGNIIGWDLRCDKEAWRMTNPLHHGSISALACDPLQQSWIVSGTLKGVMTLHDVRFLMPIRSWAHPNRSAIHKLQAHPSANRQKNKRIICAAGNNELSVWDLERGEYRELFVAAPIQEKLGRYMRTLKAAEPPKKEISPDKLSQDGKPSFLPESSFRSFLYPSECPYVITAGSDMRIRFWDLARIDQSYWISGIKDQIECQYTSQRMDNITMHYEKISKSTSKLSPTTSSASLSSLLAGRNKSSSPLASHLPTQISSSSENSYMHHHDCITDLALTEVPYPMLISASRDGVIKVWK